MLPNSNIIYKDFGKELENVFAYYENKTLYINTTYTFDSNKGEITPFFVDF